MFSSPKFLLTVGLAAAIGLVVVIVSAPILEFGEPTPEEGAEAGGLGGLPEPKVSQNAFLPASPAGGPTPPARHSFSGGGSPVGGTAPSEAGGVASSPGIGDLNGNVFLPIKPQKPPETGLGASIPTIEELRESIAGTLGVEPQKDETLPLPQIADSEVRISPSGAQTPEDYIEQFAVGSFDKISFDNQRFASILIDENKLPLLPQQLVEKGLAENNFSGVKASLIVFRDYFIAKQNFERSIGVYGEAIDTAKGLIALDVLELELIEKAIDIAEGRGSAEELKDFFNKFLNTAELHRRELLGEIGVFSYEPPGFLKKLAGFLGITNLAQAQLPFGGPIGLPIFCICNVSYWMFVGPPVPTPSGFLLANIGWVASPGLFAYKSLRPGAYWLGNYSAVPLPCMQFVGLFCVPIGFGNPPIIAGTSI